MRGRKVMVVTRLRPLSNPCAISPLSSCCRLPRWHSIRGLKWSGRSRYRSTRPHSGRSFQAAPHSTHEAVPIKRFKNKVGRPRSGQGVCGDRTSEEVTELQRTMSAYRACSFGSLVRSSLAILPAKTLSTCALRVASGMLWLPSA